jgi:hypothetical protein
MSHDNTPADNMPDDIKPDETPGMGGIERPSPSATAGHKRRPEVTSRDNI